MLPEWGTWNFRFSVVYSNYTIASTKHPRMLYIEISAVSENN